MKRILVMGLPGSGKTYLAQYILEHLQNENKTVMWLNADDVRKKYNDWDFSYSGRFRQTERMRDLAKLAESNGVIAICDFVCPTEEFRKMFDADITIWMDTIKESEYDDTNKLFEPPTEYDFRITEHNDRWPETLADLVWILV